MKRILNLVKYDYLQRVRSYKFLIVLFVSLLFASSLIPQPGAAYSTVSIGNFLGNYNSAWIAYVTAMMGSVFVALFGYYIINNSISVDKKTKVGQLVAATGITNFHYLIAKFLGNFLILLTIVICIFFVGIILFFVYDAGYNFELSQFLMAYLLLPIPTIIFIAAIAIVFEVVFKEKTILHNVAFFTLFSILLVQSWGSLEVEPFGVGFVTEAIQTQVNEIDPSLEDKMLNIGFVIANQTFDKRFDFEGISPTPLYLSFRLLWPLFGVLAIYLTSIFFHRFDLNESKTKAEKASNQQLTVADDAGLQEMDLSLLPKLEKSDSIWPVFKAEFLMMLRKGNKWLWVLNAIGMGLLIVAPLDIAHKFALPVLLFLQVHRWADLVSKEKTYQMHFFIYASFKPIQRLLSAQYLAGVSLAILLVLPLIIRYSIMGQLQPVAAIVLGAFFIIGLSAFVGIATGGKRLFEILFFFIVYLNINGLPYTDYFGGVNQSLAYLGLLAIIAIVLSVSSFLLRRFELRRI